jgi:hypothetical protein
MAVAESPNAAIAVALNDRAIGAESARLPRFAHTPVAQDYRVVVIGTNVHSARYWQHSSRMIVTSKCDDSPLPV